MPPSIARGAVPTYSPARTTRSAGADCAADLARLLLLDPAAAARFVRLGRRSFDAAAPSSLLALRADVRRWRDWCVSVGCRRRLPARPRDVAAFVDARAERWRPATLERVLSSLARVHRVLGVADPTSLEQVRAAYRAVVRRRVEAGQGGQRQAVGLTEAAVSAMLATLGGRLIDCRDRALLLVARDLLARRGELVGLRVGDLAPACGGGATIRIAHAKTDPMGRGRDLYLGPRTYTAVRTWLRAARITDGYIFRSVHVTGRVGSSLHAASVSPILKKLARRAAPTLRRHGIDPEGVSGHSCRVGMAQDLVAAGFDVVAIMQAGRWTSPEMVARYTERLHAGRGAIAQYHRILAARRRDQGAGRGSRGDVHAG